MLEARNPALREARRAALPGLRRYANFLDSSIGIPGTPWKMGVESLVGLVPALGDTAGLILSLWIPWKAWRLGASGRVWLRMVGNLLFEWLVGSIPLLGDVLDIWFKANQRNVALLEEEWGIEP